jgi:hypothetical protein
LSFHRSYLLQLSDMAQARVIDLFHSLFPVVESERAGLSGVTPSLRQPISSLVCVENMLGGMTQAISSFVCELFVRCGVAGPVIISRLSDKSEKSLP